MLCVVVCVAGLELVCQVLCCVWLSVLQALSSSAKCEITKYAGHHGAAAAARHYSRDNDRTREIILGRWPMVFPSFLTATAYLSCMVRGSLSHARVSPTTAHQIAS